MSLYRIEVYPKEWHPLPLDSEITQHMGLDLAWITKGKFYQLKDKRLSPKDVEKISQEIFSDPIVENIFFRDFDEKHLINPPPDYVAEICYRGGVTDNTARVVQEALGIVQGLQRYESLSTQCSSGTLFFIKGGLSLTQAKELIDKFYANKLMEKVSVVTFHNFQQKKRFDNIVMPQVQLTPFKRYQTYDFTQSIKKIFKLSQENIWALNQDELAAIKNYYQNEQVREQRKQRELPCNPTDVEIEILAQTWSEHCKHKIFASHIDYVESELSPDLKRLGPKKINSLYHSFIQETTRVVKEKRKIDWAVSVFSDNAGIVRYSDQVDVAIKVETHNGPSALDPYGGALTGIVGVNRDILGVGLGARPIGNTNVLCFAPSHWPRLDQAHEFPQGLLHPKRILQGVHQGIQDGGNKSGIPTINGAIYFDYHYAGRPLVFCGTIGVIPPLSPKGRELSKKYHRQEDRVVLVGGRTGVDGIHGATFSSLELNESSPLSAVQIGDPLTQRRVTDFMMAAQKKELFTSVTDNGAGGLSSSVGEMAEKTGGAQIDVALVPTKYSGIKPFELMVSESQERMTFAVAPENLDAFIALAKSYDVEACDLGKFTDHGLLEIFYEGKIVGLLNMDFLHQGLPQMKLSAHFSGERFHPFREEKKKDLSTSSFTRQVEESFTTLLACPNIASKEKWVRQYDHEVQAATIVKPFVGPTQEGPGNAGVLSLFPHGGHAREAIAVGCGMNPQLSYFDTYLMAQYAVDEAVRNLLCQGVDPQKISLLDNFCWPDPIKSAHNPDGDHKLAQLVRACEALSSMAKSYGLPYVSGKDSMKNDFRGKFPSGRKIKISIPPTLLITALGYIPQVGQIVTSDFKESEDLIFLLGKRRGGLKYSEWSRYFTRQGHLEKPPSYIDLSGPLNPWPLYLKLYQAIQAQWLESCHDISEGGLLVCLAECCFGGDLGAIIDLDGLASLEDYFSESASRFVLSVRKENVGPLRELFPHDLHFLGEVKKKDFILRQRDQKPLTFKVQDLKSLWRAL